MLWACLHFPDLPLRAVFEDGELSAPCAVVDGPRQRQHLAFVNAHAAQGGTGAGNTLAAARAVCPNLQARGRDRAAEQRRLLSLAAWSYRFSSHVSVSEPDALLIEVGASLRLFGGWPALERRLRGELAAIGQMPGLAVAPVPAAARVLAANQDGFCTDRHGPMLSALGGVALARSGLQQDTIALLYNVGARTLRDAFALPRPELGRRIGAAELAALERMRGAGNDVLALYQPPPRFEHRVEFDYRIEAWPPLLFPLRRLCGELALFLAARDGGVQRCALRLDHEDKPPTRIAIELLAPQREAHVLYDLVRSRLERASLPAPVCGMALIADELPEFRPRHQDLFESGRDQALEWPELAERLRAHLGDDAVRGLAPAPDHRPENAWRFASVSELRASYASRPQANPARKPSTQAAVPGAVSASSDRCRDPRPASPSAAARDAVHGIPQAHEPLPQAAIHGAASARHPASPSAAARDAIHGISQARQLRPLWLLHHALPLRGPVPRVLAGPERIESGWWDGGDARRDYYVVETRDGQRAWAYLAADATDGWMLHGWFA